MAGWFNGSEVEGLGNGTGWIGRPMTTKLMEYEKRYQRKYGDDSINQRWGEKILTFKSRFDIFFRCKKGMKEKGK
jgi:hypothetical protein